MTRVPNKLSIGLIYADLEEVEEGNERIPIPGQAGDCRVALGVLFVGAAEQNPLFSSVQLGGGS